MRGGAAIIGENLPKGRFEQKSTMGLLNKKNGMLDEGNDDEVITSHVFSFYIEGQLLVITKPSMEAKVSAEKAKWAATRREQDAAREAEYQKEWEKVCHVMPRTHAMP